MTAFAVYAVFFSLLLFILTHNSLDIAHFSGYCIALQKAWQLEG